MKEVTLLNTYVETWEHLQKMRLATMNRVRAWVMEAYANGDGDSGEAEGEKKKQYSDEQILALEYLPGGLRSIIETLRGLEEESLKHFARELKNEPLYIEHLSNIKGVGPSLAGRLLHHLGDLSQFPNVAKLWSYCGLDGPGWRQRARNWKMTSICFLLAESFQRQKPLNGSKYRDIYDRRKAYELTKPACEKCQEQGFEDCCRPAHTNNRARRYAVKEFLKDFWLVAHGEEVTA